jgi:hypothetical protein
VQAAVRARACGGVRRHGAVVLEGGDAGGVGGRRCGAGALEGGAGVEGGTGALNGGGVARGVELEA